MLTSRSAFVGDLMAAFATNPAYTAALGTDTDLTILSNPVHPSWGAGNDRVEYAAALKAVEGDKIVYFWEAVKHRASGGFASERHVAEPKGAVAAKTAAVGPGSVSWEWGYGTLRALVDEVAARHGFTVHSVVTRSAASW